MLAGNREEAGASSRDCPGCRARPPRRRPDRAHGPPAVVEHPQEQVLGFADRAPQSPRDLGGPAHDLVVMRGRRQHPVRFLSHGYMLRRHSSAPFCRAGLALPSIQSPRLRGIPSSTWPTRNGVSPRCPRTGVNSQQVGAASYRRQQGRRRLKWDRRRLRPPERCLGWTYLRRSCSRYPQRPACARCPAQAS
jgi:hypothetical protein